MFQNSRRYSAQLSLDKYIFESCAGDCARSSMPSRNLSILLLLSLSSSVRFLERVALTCETHVVIMLLPTHRLDFCSVVTFTVARSCLAMIIVSALVPNIKGSCQGLLNLSLSAAKSTLDYWLLFCRPVPWLQDTSFP